MKDYPWGKGTVNWLRDATANDSDKSFTVPAGKIWDVMSIAATLATTATVGNRILHVYITDGTNTVYSSPSSGNVAASGYGGIRIVPGSNYTTSALFGRLDTPTGMTSVSVTDSPSSKLYLPAGYVIRVWDRAAIDAAADDMTVVLHYMEYDA